MRKANDLMHTTNLRILSDMARYRVAVVRFFGGAAFSPEVANPAGLRAYR